MILIAILISLLWLLQWITSTSRERQTGTSSRNSMTCNWARRSSLPCSQPPRSGSRGRTCRIRCRNSCGAGTRQSAKRTLTWSKRRKGGKRREQKTVPAFWDPERSLRHSKKARMISAPSSCNRPISWATWTNLFSTTITNCMPACQIRSLMTNLKERGLCTRSWSRLSFKSSPW